MSGTDVEDLPDDTQQAIEALRRLVRKHEAVAPDEAIETVRALIADADVEASPEALLGLSEDEAETAGETESPTA